MKPEEALNKWCPFVRVAANQGRVAVNRLVQADGSVTAPQGTFCIAGDCAMWRWRVKPDPHAYSGEWATPHNGDGVCGMIEGPAYKPVGDL